MQPSAPIRTRVAPAVVHFLQGLVVLLLVIIPIAPAWVVLLAVFSPLYPLGFISSDDAVGLPEGYCRWRRFPLQIPMVLFVDLPIAFLLALYAAAWVCILLPITHVAFEVVSLFAPFQNDHRSKATCTGRVESTRDSGVRSASSDVEAPTRSFSHLRAQRADGTRYRDHDSVWKALEGDSLDEDSKVRPGDVRLLSLNWMIARAAEGKALPRRQDLEKDHPEAFIDAAELRQIEKGARLAFNPHVFGDAIGAVVKGGGLLALVKLLACLFRRERNADNLLPIVSVSYCWLEPGHPDRDGRQLQLLCDKLKDLYGGRGLLGVCKDYGFSDMGVFIDWTSGYQKDTALWSEWMANTALYSLSDDELRKVADRERFVAERHAYEAMADRALYALSEDRLRNLPDGERLVADRRAYEESRSVEEKAAFGRMLENTMDLWYAHSSITVVLLTQLPEQLPPGFDSTRTYGSRGWTTFERCSAELAKSFKLGVAKWKLVIDVADANGGAQRRLPTTPEQMEALLADCRFTNGSDEKTVLRLYEQTALAVLGTVEGLNFLGLPLNCDDKWCSPAKLAAALDYCCRLKHLNLAATQLNDRGVEDLARGLPRDALPALQRLDVAAGRFGTDGINALIKAFNRGVAPALQEIHLGCNPIGDAGAAALAAAIAAGRLPTQIKWLDLQGWSISNEGAETLAEALLETGSGCRIACSMNRIGIAGQSALLKAHETRHGPSIAHGLTILPCNGTIWPAAFSRAVSRAGRRALETGTILL